MWSRQRRSKAEILYGSAPANGFGQDHWRSHSPGARPPTRLLLPALRSPCLCLLAIGIAGFGSFRSGANRLFAFGICKPSFDGHAVTQCSHCSASYNRCCRQRAPWLWPSGKNCISGGTNFQRMRSFRVGRETKNAPGHRPVLESTLDLLAARHAPSPHRRCPGFPAGKRRWGTTPRTAGALPSFKLASSPTQRVVSGRRLSIFELGHEQLPRDCDHHLITVAGSPGPLQFDARAPPPRTETTRSPSSAGQTPISSLLTPANMFRANSTEVLATRRH